MKKACCEKLENMVPQQIRPDLLVNKCVVCGCNHYELTVDPIKLGLVGKGI